MPNSTVQARYNKARFDWKKALSKDPELSGGAKLLAVTICDTYVSKSTGMFWPKNETLSGDVNKTVRTVQRNLRELEAFGWIERVRKSRVRRAYRLRFPSVSDHHREHDIQDDTKHDNHSASSVPKASHEHDSAVTPHKNQGYNQTNSGHTSQQPLKYFLFGEAEKPVLSRWKAWIKEHLSEPPEEVFQMLRKGSFFAMPCRYPKEGENEQYRAFFDAVMASNGKCLPG